MKNHILPIEAIRNKTRLGFPDSYTDVLKRDMTALLARIDELEHALAPFARLTSIPFNDDAYILCNRKDAARAAQVMDKDNSVPLR